MINNEYTHINLVKLPSLPDNGTIMFHKQRCSDNLLPPIA